MRKIKIFDTTLRDGEQATDGAIYGVESKLIIARKLQELGVDRIEAGFPISSPADFGAVSRIAKEIDGPWIFGLTRTRVEEVAQTYKAVKYSNFPGIHVFSLMFDPNSISVYQTTKDKVISDSRTAVACARELIGDRGQVEFSFQNATNAPMEWLLEGYGAVIQAGANVINVPDTVGYNEPEEIAAIIQTLRANIPQDVKISIHCHNDLGKAVANSLAAVKAGADIVECTINGIGERAGNAALEEIVMNIVTRRDIYHCEVGIRTELLNEVSDLVSYHFRMPVPPNKAIVGRGAFRHSSGIHQDGMIKGGVYEIITPESVGWHGEGYELTARSGKKGVNYRLKRLGYTVTEELIESIMPIFKQLADRKRKLDDLDLVVLMDKVTLGDSERYRFIDMAISKAIGSDNYEAKVLIEVDGKKISSEQMRGNGKIAGASKPSNRMDVSYGAIDALYHAVDSIIGEYRNLHLVHYNPINIGTGSEAVAEVTVVLSKDRNFDGAIKPFNGFYVGRAYHQDTLRASVEAYINALNKAVISK